MLRNASTKLALFVTNLALIACLGYAIAPNQGMAASSAPAYQACMQVSNCAQAAPNKTCYDYVCPQPQLAAASTTLQCVCTPQCNKTCACVLSALAADGD